MTVALLPPISISGPYRSPGPDPVALTEAPNYVRSRNADRWHRPRSAVDYGSHVRYHYWCGQSPSSPILGTEQRPPREPLCGTCEGRAIGAGQVTRRGLATLLFEPRWSAPPAQCPGGKTRSKLYQVLNPDDWRSPARCLMCGFVGAVRGCGGRYQWDNKLVSHPPGPGLISGCDFHGWRHFTKVTVDGQPVAVCECRVRR